LLGLLEEKMEQLLGRRVVIDLRLYKLSGGSGPQPVVSGQADFQRLGPLAYVRARQNVPGLEPLVMPLPFHVKSTPCLLRLRAH
jgi:hypothetical protein